ncbi:hypothetical protein DDB_G0275281 [Dictyostelium discoideum AX4]|uniref:MATH domain-containing protein n=1 Tax=Dictyostelium discoideum TaxID=44689 RepID=Q553Z8_DICDI|nr:hypothetical protein DDB_G0275281 [Dictyostelium discoideum AX4]EAL69921.1 hypothetical protein DDB_G0275281 [Dictyostelium discoideum AX4]|eukprot:XP_643813.1 hypothetical protein DDB_G0275281 [Dictyostelium discoideum AX4]
MKELNHGYVTFVRLFTILNQENGFLVNNTLKIKIDMASTSPLIDNINKFNLGSTQTHSYRVPNISKKLDAFVSPVFRCCEKQWAIKVHPCGQPISNQMSVYLEYRDQNEENVLFSLELVSQTYPDKSIKNWVQYLFNSKNLSFGYPKFIGIFSLFDPEMGFIINDSIIINVTVIQLKPIKRRFLENKKVFFLFFFIKIQMSYYKKKKNPRWSFFFYFHLRLILIKHEQYSPKLFFIFLFFYFFYFFIFFFIIRYSKNKVPFRLLEFFQFLFLIFLLSKSCHIKKKTVFFFFFFLYYFFKL